MRHIIIISMLILAAIILGCTENTVECTPPNKIVRENCCIDTNNNNICDMDEAKLAETKTNDTKQPVVENNKTITAPAINKTEEKKVTPTTTAQTNTLEEATKTGKLFAEKWQAKQYTLMYAMFTPQVKEKKTLTEFTTIMQLDTLYKRITKVDFNGVKMVDDNTAELNILFHTTIQDITVTGASLEYMDGAWKVNAFVDVFDLPTFDAACTGYKNDKDYTEADCALDYAKKLKDASYCEQSKCHYLECLKALSQPTGTKQQFKQCELCTTYDKTTNQCILDLAIKQDSVSICDMINEDSYSDKYCVCYGGYAKSKGTIGYCNIIQNSDNRDLCIKAYNGEYC